MGFLAPFVIPAVAGFLGYKVYQNKETISQHLPNLPTGNTMQALDKVQGILRLIMFIGIGFTIYRFFGKYIKRYL